MKSSVSRFIIVLGLFAAPIIGWTQDELLTNDEEGGTGSG